MVFALDFSAEKFLKSLLAFFSFSLISSSVYIFNDIVDSERDKLHPLKQYRPLARGDVSLREAFIHMIILFLFAVTAAFLLNFSFLFIILFYFTLNILYSLYIKDIPIFDTVSIGLGFILRLFAGSTASGINLSNWIILVTFNLSLFIAFSKRLDDLELYMEGIKSRRVITKYNREFLNFSILFTSLLSAVTYTIFTIVEYGHTELYLTVFFVILGFLRYFYHIFVIKDHGNPVDLILRDKILLIIFISWLSSYILILWNQLSGE